MFVATVIVSVLLAALLALSAFIKITRREPYVSGYLRVGVPESRLNQLAALLLAGAAAVLIGLWWAPLGVAVAIALSCYFLIAIGFHLRARDYRNLATPLTYLTLAVAALVLRLATG